VANKAEKLLIIGGSDAGVSAALKAKELKPELEVQVLLADEYPNLSICGLPYAISGEVANWRSLAHRGLKELTATGVKFQMNMIAEKIDCRIYNVSATPK
jgi:NADPH-dependent 2,4-dienoyl-CoA reductase/sulfur reductase-like enzyme